MERNNKLPEKWYIKGSVELVDHLKLANNNPNGVIGDSESYIYYINENEIWDYCFSVDPNYQKITLQQYLNSIKPNNNNKMKTIEIPEGYNLNLEKLIELGIVTKSIPEKETKMIAETYDDIIKDIDSDNIGCFAILDYNKHSNVDAFVKLLNTATYLNKMYEKDINQNLWYFNYEYISNVKDYHDNIDIDWCRDDITYYDSTIYFNSKEAINKALDILGEETIKLALKFN